MATEKLVITEDGNVVPYQEMIPTRRNQAFEEILEKQRVFSKVIYFQKDQDRRNY